MPRSPSPMGSGNTLSSGNISNSSGSGVASGLTNTGTTTLSGTKTYNRITTVNGGTLLLHETGADTLASTSARIDQRPSLIRTLISPIRCLRWARALLKTYLRGTASSLLREASLQSSSEPGSFSSFESRQCSLGRVSSKTG